MHNIPQNIFIRGVIAVAVGITALNMHSTGGIAFCPGEACAQSTGTTKANPEMIGLQESFSRVATQIEPAVVNVSTVIEEKASPRYEFFFGSPFGEPGNSRRSPTQRVEGIASGVIVSAEGYILTNEHVVHDAKSIRVTLANERKFTGKLVGRDARTDLAVIKINSEKPFPFAKLGDSDKIKVGDWALAVGSPFGLEETLTAGIISAKRQSLSIEGNTYTNLLQTDAAINRGNSGGPLCNINGEVIAINTAIYAPTGVFSGVGFAIPINNAKEVMDSLIHKGKVVRSWLGVEIRPVDDAIARQFGLPDTSGVLINSILPRSPAAASLQRGDVIRAVNGKKIVNSQDLQAAISQIEPNNTIQVQVIRNRETTDVRLKTGEMPSEEQMTKMSPGTSEEKGSEPQAAAAEWEGLKVATVSRTLARRFGVPEGIKGCVVVDVSQGSAADEMGVQPGDIILVVNKVSTPTTKEFKAAVDKVKLAEGVVIDVNRQGRQLFLSFSQQ
jgi:Do/DeqQ family serine protease